MNINRKIKSDLLIIKNELERKFNTTILMIVENGTRSKGIGSLNDPYKLFIITESLRVIPESTMISGMYINFEMVYKDMTELKLFTKDQEYISRILLSTFLGDIYFNYLKSTYLSGLSSGYISKMLLDKSKESLVLSRRYKNQSKIMIDYILESFWYYLLYKQFPLVSTIPKNKDLLELTEKTNRILKIFNLSEMNELKMIYQKRSRNNLNYEDVKFIEVFLNKTIQ